MPIFTLFLVFDHKNLKNKAQNNYLIANIKKQFKIHNTQ